MPRLLLLLLLAMSLRPSGVAAEPGVPVEQARQEIRSVAPDYGHAGLRPAGAVDLLLRLNGHGALCARCSGACPHGSGATGPARSYQRPECPIVHLQQRFAPHVEDIDGAVPPHCERLPYFATAPPRPR